MKKIFLLFTLIFFHIATNAQQANGGNKEKGKEKIRAIKIAYLTEKLDLTSTEAEQFWPIFNEYHKKRRELFNYEKQQLKQKIEEGYDISKVTDEEAKKVLKKIFEYREQRYKNKISFHKELEKILPPKKILILEVTEKEFKI